MCQMLTNMREMFQDATFLIIDIGSWTTSSVNMNICFFITITFNGDNK